MNQTINPAIRYGAIVRDGAGTVYAVRDGGPGLEHAYLGVRARRIAGAYAPRPEAERLVRRAGCTVVAEAV